MRSGAERADERRDADRDRRQHQQRAEQSQPPGAGSREIRPRQADPSRERDAAREREPRRGGDGMPSGPDAAGPAVAARCDAGRRPWRSGEVPSSHRVAAARAGRWCDPGRSLRTRSGGRAGAASVPRPTRNRRSARVAAERRDRPGADLSGLARAGSASASVVARAPARTAPARTAPARTAPAKTAAGTTTAPARRAAATTALARTAPARRCWDAGVAPWPHRRRRDDRAAGECAGRASPRCGVGACRRRRPCLSADSGGAAGSSPDAIAGSSPDAIGGSSPDAAARAQTARRARPRSTSSGAGSRATPPAVPVASPGPIEALRAGARSTSVQTPLSAQVVAARSA